MNTFDMHVNAHAFVLPSSTFNLWLYGNENEKNNSFPLNKITSRENGAWPINAERDEKI